MNMTVCVIDLGTWMCVGELPVWNGMDDVWHCMGAKMAAVLIGMGVVWNGMGATCKLHTRVGKALELCVWEITSFVCLCVV